MKTYGLKDEQGNEFAFEVNNFLLDRLDVCALVRRIPGAKLMLVPSGRGEADFCEFELDDVVFLVSEPFGDNSRYWVGPKPPVRGVPQLARVRAAFDDARRVWDFLPWRKGA
ncbi:MAG: hypothetical protein AB7F79_06480 [Steroidobacteraceae bacterium]